MRILLDHCIDWRLKRLLPSHDVKSAHEMGWSELQNGKLLAAAAPLFDVMLTVDRNIKSQQNLATLPIAIVVLVARSNRTEDLVPLIPAFERLLPSLALGQLIEVDFAGNATTIAQGRNRTT
jgi:hypothetical protein